MINSSKNKRRKRRKHTVVGRAGKYRSMVMGALLILIGFGSIIYTLDYEPNLKSVFELSKLKDWMNLWPFWITLLGFAFVIYDYLKNNSKEKYK